MMPIQKIKENLNLDKKLSLDLKDKVNNLQKKYDNLNKEYLYLKITKSI